MGGGVTHLVELLSAADPKKNGFSEIIIWANTSVINALPNKPWLKKIAPAALEKGLLHRIAWNCFIFPCELKDVDILFVPGGTYLGKFRPFVNMFQNALPFEKKEKNRFLFTSPLYYFKWNLLKLTQGLTHKLTQGALFPSYYLEDLVWKNKPHSRCAHSRVVPHGINTIFFNPPRTEPEKNDAKKEIR